MSLEDPFFRDFFVKAFFGGSFFDRIHPGEDYAIFLVFWRSNNLNPINRVPTENRKEPESPELHVSVRDKFSRAVHEMGFLVKGDNLSAFRFADWFNRLAKYVVANLRSPAGLKLAGFVRNGVFVLNVRAGKREFDVKLHPCFAYPHLDRLPCCTIDIGQLARSRRMSQVVKSEWYAVPERVFATFPSGRRRGAATDDHVDDDEKEKDADKLAGFKRKRMTRWSFVAPAGDSAALFDTNMCKPLLRLFLTLNEKLGWGLPPAGIKNMFIDEALLHKDFDFWTRLDIASLFMLMLGKLSACLDAGFFPTIWDSSLVHFTNGSRNRAKADVEKLRDHILAAFRRLARANDTALSQDSDEADQKQKELRSEVYDSIRTCLTGDLTELDKPKQAKKAKKRARADGGGDGQEERRNNRGRRGNRRGSKPSGGKVGDKTEGD